MIGRFVIILGVVFAALMLLQVHAGEVSVDDVFGLVMEEGQTEGARDLIDVFVQPEEAQSSVAPDVEQDSSLRIFAVGDIMLGRYVRTLMNKYGLDYVFERLDFEALTKDADVVFGNLEGPIFGEGRSGGTAMVFAFNHDVGPLLKKYGFDVLSVANNHAVDMGWGGREETIATLEENDLGWCGHPSEVPRESVYFGENEAGVTYAFVCLHSVTFALDTDAAVALISELDKEVDEVIVSIHWGTEYRLSATQNQQVEPGHRFVDAGADLVIGHHPHVVENFEIYNGVPIFYSLGNFIFDQYWAQVVQEELAIDVSLSKKGYEIELIPLKSEKSQSRLMTEEEKGRWLREYLKHGDYDEATAAMILAGRLEIAR